MIRLLSIVGLVCAIAGGANAQIRPTPGIGDPRIQTVLYDADQVIQITAATGYQVTLEFGADERIENIAVGDSGAWQVSANRSGDHLFIKAVQPVPTNMTVVTSVRVYTFELTPIGGVSGNLAYTVRFTYPSPNVPAPTLAADARVEGRYRLSGARTVRPIRISDDGIHTYIEFPPSAAIPAIYALDDTGRETLVNGMMRDGIFVVDAVSVGIVFRIDAHVARAIRARQRAG